VTGVFRSFRKCLLLAVVLPYVMSAASPDSMSTSGGHTPWEFSLSGSYYAYPAVEDNLIAVARANRGDLQFEARYNYEDRKTGSVFAGWTFSAGRSLRIAMTPMAGMAFGRTTGVVPALEASLGAGMFDFYAETEYLIDVHDNSGNFSYSWLELGVAPIEIIRLGLTAQRSRIVQSPLVLDRGLFAQIAPGPGKLSLYAFNLFTESWFLVMGIEISW